MTDDLNYCPTCGGLMTKYLGLQETGWDCLNVGCGSLAKDEPNGNVKVPAVEVECEKIYSLGPTGVFDKTHTFSEGMVLLAVEVGSTLPVSVQVESIVGGQPSLLWVGNTNPMQRCVFQQMVAVTTPFHTKINVKVTNQSQSDTTDVFYTITASNK